MNGTTLCIQKWEWPSSVQLKWMAEMKLEQLVEIWEWQEQQLLYPQVYVGEALLAAGYGGSCWSTL